MIRIADLGVRFILAQPSSIGWTSSHLAPLDLASGIWSYSALGHLFGRFVRPSRGRPGGIHPAAEILGQGCHPSASLTRRRS